MGAARTHHAMHQTLLKGGWECHNFGTVLQADSAMDSGCEILCDMHSCHIPNKLSYCKSMTLSMICSLVVKSAYDGRVMCTLVGKNMS